MAVKNYAKTLEPRLKKLQVAGISINEIFRRADVSRSNWSRWSSGDTSPTLTTHFKLLDAIDKAEAEVARKLARKKHVVNASDL